MNKYETQARKAREARKQKKMCLDKKSFASKALAQDPNNKGVVVYQCKYCRKWHRSRKFSKFIHQLHTTKKMKNMKEDDLKGFRISFD